jgi:hypothetical protein
MKSGKSSCLNIGTQGITPGPGTSPFKEMRLANFD